MRSADPVRFRRAPARAVLLPGALLMAVALSGCAVFKEPLDAIRQTVMLPASPPASSAAPAPAPAAAAVARADDPPPVALPVQRAFDDALRALRAGRTDEAERGFRALAQAHPELGGPHANLGAILRQAGKLDESASELERAVALNPRQPVYLNQLGITYRHQGRFDKAREAYERALALDPDYAAAVLNLGILHDLYLGDAQRALELYSRYLALTPAGDPAVGKWVAEIRNRKPAPVVAARKEKA
jgi:tetratricopeptide (TPR) repeat protein